MISVYKVLEAATRGVLWRKVFLKIFQNLQENTFAGVSFLIKLQAWGLKLWRNSGPGRFLLILQKF